MNFPMIKVNFQLNYSYIIFINPQKIAEFTFMELFVKLYLLTLMHFFRLLSNFLKQEKLVIVANWKKRKRRIIKNSKI